MTGLRSRTNEHAAKQAFLNGLDSSFDKSRVSGLFVKATRGNTSAFTLLPLNAEDALMTLAVFGVLWSIGGRRVDDVDQKVARATFGGKSAVLVVK